MLTFLLRPALRSPGDRVVLALSPPLPVSVHGSSRTWEWEPSARIRGFTHPLMFATVYKALQIVVRRRATVAGAIGRPSLATNQVGTRGERD